MSASTSQHAAAADLPAGIVTFLFTDIEDSADLGDCVAARGHAERGAERAQRLNETAGPAESVKQ